MKFRYFSCASIILAGLLWVSCGGSSSSKGIIYITTQGDGMVSTWQVDESSGSLTKKYQIPINPDSKAPAPVPSAVAITPQKDAVYVADQPLGPDPLTMAPSSLLQSKLWVFKINGDHSLSPNGEIDLPTYVCGHDLVGNSINCALLVNPRGMAFDASGSFLFVAFQGTGQSVQTQGATFLGTGGIAVINVKSSPPSVTLYSTQAPGVVTGPVSVAVTKVVQGTGNPVTGNHIYVANSITNTVSAFSFDSNGVLTPVALASGGVNYLSVGTTPNFVAVSQNNGFLYVANTGDGSISGFQICENETANCLTPTGALTSLGTVVANLLHPVFIAFEPIDGTNFVYVVDNAGRVYEYQYGEISGAFTPLQAAPYVGTGASPTWATFAIINPSLTTNQKHYLYVSNSAGHSISGYFIFDQIKTPGTSSTGVLAPVQGSMFNTADQPTTVVSP